MRTPKIIVKSLNLYYSNLHVLKNINIEIYPNEILSIIGPAKSGKSTLLKVLNRLIDIEDDVKIAGEIIYNNKNIYDNNVDVSALRQKIGIVFDLPVVLPKSIYENIVYGLRIKGIRDKKYLDRTVQEALELTALWEEVKDRLNEPATRLSGGQQQRLCIARILALKPDVILLDEATSGLDPISTSKIEKSLETLKNTMPIAIIFVTNNVKQAIRISDKIAFLLAGEIIEYGKTEEVSTTPKNKYTEDYLQGRFG
jgi:phosphate transport system ATP-binding protein